MMATSSHSGCIWLALLGRTVAPRLAGPRLQQGFALLSLGIAAGLLAKAAS